MIGRPLHSSLDWPLTARRHTTTFVRGIGVDHAGANSTTARPNRG
ncbi:hypothetical protein [Rhodococcus sp. 14-2470-1a]|nr:hypothetical protein [Rhodococcus sp. 14-2470-1a]